MTGTTNSAALRRRLTSTPTTVFPSSPERPVLGANAIATWDSTTGLVEAGRRCVAALIEMGIDVALDDVDIGAPRDPRRFPVAFRGLQKGRPHPIDIFFVNVNELQSLDDDYVRPPHTSRYVIGSWYWELPELPSWMQHQARRVDEIWVASDFVADAFSRYVDVPITVIPPVVAPRADPLVGRSRFGIDDDACMFLFSFDADSTFARKNPWGVIDAFRTAFTRQERLSSAKLVIKSLNLSRYREGGERLRHELALVGGVLVDEDLSSGEMAALIKCSDAYVSLHRAEGFGLGMAEAMYFGRPVIATNYSGNRDFTTPTTSLPVGYRLREVELGELRYNRGVESVYEPGMLWAEPDATHAAEWMRRIYSDPMRCAAVGQRGRAKILEHYSISAAAEAMRSRLVKIAAGISAA